MKKNIKYYILSVLLVSFVIMAERETMYNISEKTEINLIYSNIYTTVLSMGVEDFDLLEIDGTPGKYKVHIDQGTSILEEGILEV